MKNEQIKQLVKKAFDEALRIDDQEFNKAFNSGVKKSDFWNNSDIKKELLNWGIK